MVKREPRILINNVLLIKVVSSGVTLFLLVCILNKILYGTTIIPSFSDLNQVRTTWLESRGGLKNHIMFLLSVFVLPFVSICTSYWNAINKEKKLLLFLIFIWYILESIGGGNRSGIYFIFLIIFIGIFTATIAKRNKISLKKFIVLNCILVFFFILYSGAVAVSRKNTSSSEYVNIVLSVRESGAQVKTGHPFLYVLPDWLSPSIIAATYYLGHGYDGLAKCLEKPFIGVGWGMGSSAVVMRNMRRLLGDDDIFYRSYFYRLQREDGFSGSLWITMYPWIASDVSFIGSIVVLYFLGWLMGACWISSLKYYDPFAAICLAVIFSTMMNCHNNFSTGDYVSLFLFWGSISSFVITRRRKFR